MIYVWVQHAHGRNSSPTFESIHASDIGRNYTLVTDEPRKFPEDGDKLQAWWADTCLAQADAAEARGCKWILRLEDDIIVNRHILHNIQHWPALHDPLFGFGTLFVPDRWLRRPMFARGVSGEWYCKFKDVAGAQAQVYSVERIRAYIPLVPEMRRARGLGRPGDPPSFDWALSRAAHYYGARTHQMDPQRVFIHKDPSLVDLAPSSLQSAMFPQAPQDPNLHYWGTKSFNAEWRRYDDIRC